jgi:hypothetical protein
MSNVVEESRNRDSSAPRWLRFQPRIKRNLIVHRSRQVENAHTVNKAGMLNACKDKVSKAILADCAQPLKCGQISKLWDEVAQSTLRIRNIEHIGSK